MVPAPPREGFASVDRDVVANKVMVDRDFHCPFLIVGQPGSRLLHSSGHAPAP